MENPTPELSIEVPLIYVEGAWVVDPRAVDGEPLFGTGDPYIDGGPVPGGDAMLAAACATPLPDGTELAQLLRDAAASLVR